MLGEHLSYVSSELCKNGFLPLSLSLSLSPNKNTTILRISFPRVDSIVTYRECNQMENAEGSIFRGDLEGFRYLSFSRRKSLFWEISSKSWTSNNVDFEIIIEDRKKSTDMLDVPFDSAPNPSAYNFIPPLFDLGASSPFNLLKDR